MAQWEAKDKTFIITGGASGAGAEYVETFLNEGAKNVAILDIAKDLGKATEERLNKVHGNKAVFIKCDMSKEEDITNAFDSVLAKFKQIDVIVNNAGVMCDSPEIWRTSVNVNYQGLVSLTLKGVKYMRKDEGGVGGTIINVASEVALMKPSGLPIYSGSKAAVLHFSQCLAMDPFYDNTGVRLLTFCLGATDTFLLKNLECRAYEPKLGKILGDAESKGFPKQTTASAAAALLQTFNTGAPGTIWLSVQNKPAKNITQAIDNVFKDYEKLLAE